MLPKKILFCTDFSANSEPARVLAVDFAKAFKAQLLIVHVIDSSGFPSDVDWVTPSMSGEINELLRHIQEAAEERMASLASKCELDVKTYLRVGFPPYEIVDVAHEQAVDLIVVGTHGRTGVKYLVMGSIARSVLKTAHRPVLVVEAPAEKGETSEQP